jgi:hypothetical protein
MAQFIVDFKIEPEGEVFTLVRNFYQNTGRRQFEIVNWKGDTIHILTLNRVNIALARRQFLVPLWKWDEVKPYFKALEKLGVFQFTGDKISTKRDGKLMVWRETNHGLLKSDTDNISPDDIVGGGTKGDQGNQAEAKRQKDSE